MEPLTIIFMVAASFSSGFAIANWKLILICINGKQLAVLGDKATGKTTLLTYLIKKVEIQGYRETRYSTETDKSRFRLDDKRWVSLKQSIDVGGDDSFYAEWKSLFKESDMVFYLVRADLLINKDKDTESRVEQDINLIQGWRAEYDPKNKKKLLIICTFCDQVDSLQRHIPRMIGKDELRRIFPLLAEHGKGIRVALGSLLTKDNNDNTEKTVKLAFKDIIK